MFGTYVKKNWLLLSVILMLAVVLMFVSIGRNKDNASNITNSEHTSSESSQSSLAISEPQTQSSKANAAFDAFEEFDYWSDGGEVIYSEDGTAEKRVSWIDYVTYVNTVLSSQIDNIRAWDDHGQLDIDLFILTEQNTLEKINKLSDVELYEQYAMPELQKVWNALGKITSEYNVEFARVSLIFSDATDERWSWHYQFSQTGENGNIYVNVNGRDSQSRSYVLDSESLMPVEDDEDSLWWDEDENADNDYDSTVTPAPSSIPKQKPDDIYIGTKDQYITAAKSLIYKDLKNPNSVIWNSESLYDTDEYGRAIVYIDYSAQNGFGGYNRHQYYVCIQSVDREGRYTFMKGMSAISGEYAKKDYLWSSFISMNSFGEYPE